MFFLFAFTSTPFFKGSCPQEQFLFACSSPSWYLPLRYSLIVFISFSRTSIFLFQMNPVIYLHHWWSLWFPPFTPKSLNIKMPFSHFTVFSPFDRTHLSILPFTPFLWKCSKIHLESLWLSCIWLYFLEYFYLERLYV